MLLTYLIYTQYAYTPKKPVALYFMWPPSAYTIQVHAHVSKLSFFLLLNLYNFSMYVMSGNGMDRFIHDIKKCTKTNTLQGSFRNARTKMHPLTLQYYVTTEASHSRQQHCIVGAALTFTFRQPIHLSP